MKQDSLPFDAIDKRYSRLMSLGFSMLLAAFPILVIANNVGYSDAGGIAFMSMTIGSAGLVLVPVMLWDNKCGKEGNVMGYSFGTSGIYWWKKPKSEVPYKAFQFDFGNKKVNL